MVRLEGVGSSDTPRALVKIVLLSQYYPPEVGAPQNRLSDFSKRMVGLGHEVTVLTAMPNYPTGKVFPSWRRKVIAQELQDDVRVLRSWIYPGRTSTVRQLASYASFMLSVLVTAPWRVRRADVLIWESPPLFLAPVAWLLARRLRARLVMNVSDLWPQSAIDLGMLPSRRLRAFFSWWERRAYESSDLVLGQTQHILRGVNSAAEDVPVHLFPNGVDLEYFTPRTRDTSRKTALAIPEGNYVVSYIGTLGRAQALEQVLDAAGLLEPLTNVTFLVMGDGPQAAKLRAEAADRKLGNIVFHDPLPRSEMPSVLSIVDVALVPLADRPVFEGARPSKMFELFASELPVIFCGRGEGADLARAAGAVVVEPEQPDQLADGLRKLLAMSDDGRKTLGVQGRTYVTAHYSRDRIALDVQDRLNDLLAGKRHRGA